ncbi:MAG: hypothetical protein AAGI01_14285, partial [Myxococcota bacterium]
MKQSFWAHPISLAVVWVLLCFAPPELEAKPAGSVEFCSVYPDVPLCTQGAVDCSTCHTVPPARNLYGAQVALGYDADLERPL